MDLLLKKNYIIILLLQLLPKRLRLCLVRVKAFPENILFSRKKNVFMCLAASKFVLQKINFGVWFVQIFLQKILYIAKPPNFPYTSSAVNMQIMNQFHTHSQKKQNPAKKFIKFGQIEIARRRRR